MALVRLGIAYAFVFVCCNYTFTLTKSACLLSGTCHLLMACPGVLFLGQTLLQMCFTRKSLFLFGL